MKTEYRIVATMTFDTVVDRDDWWDMWKAQDEFFRTYCPDLAENPRAATLLKGIKLDLPEMLIEIEVVAIISK